MKVKISVIVPVYNVEKFLEKCVKSILSQSFKNLEIILVDDGSTDNSGLICDQLKDLNNNIIVIHKENGGLSSARNAGIDVATGDYLSFIDSDDYIEPSMYEEMIKGIHETNKDIACCGRIVDVYGTHENYEFCLDNTTVYSKEEAMKEIMHFSSIDVAAWDKLYKKELFESVRYPEGKISEDAAVIFELIQSSNGVVHVGKPFYHYVFRKNSISKSNYSEKNFDVLTNLENTKKFIDINFPNLIEDYKIYSCITSAAQIVLLSKDKNALKKYKMHYKTYYNYFNDGYRLTMKLNNLSKNNRFRYFCIRHKFVSFYNFVKKNYQRKYNIKNR